MFISRHVILQRQISDTVTSFMWNPYAGNINRVRCQTSASVVICLYRNIIIPQLWCMVQRWSLKYRSNCHGPKICYYGLMLFSFGVLVNTLQPGSSLMLIFVPEVVISLCLIFRFLYSGIIRVFVLVLLILWCLCLLCSFEWWVLVLLSCVLAQLCYQ